MEEFFTVWFVLSIPFAFWAMKVADYRGRPEWIGFVLGLLGGLLGVAAAWLLPPDERVVWERRRSFEEFRAGH